MKKTIYVLWVLLVLAVSFISCSKSVDDYDGKETLGNVKLTLRARAVSGGTSPMTVSTPINIYVFDANEKCVAVKTLATESEATDVKLLAGEYKLYAVAGAEDSNYTLPTKEEATPRSVVLLNDNKQHSDLMTASSSVVLVDGKDAEATLQMQRKVLLLTEVIVTDVPDDVAEIKATISPLYENLRIDGQYDGSSGSEQMSLAKQGTTNTWRYDCNAFLLPSVGNPTVKFTFTTSDGKTKTFTYSSSKPLLANYKVSMNVNYIKIKNPTLKCVINGVEWDGTDSWNIDADERTFTSDEGNDDSGSEVDDSAPKAGSVYKGCYVLKTETKGGVTKAVLVTPDSKQSLTFTNGDNSSISEAVNKAIHELSVEGITTWRLPTLDEILYIKDHAEEINKSLPSSISRFPPSGSSYYFLDDNSNICVYYMASGATDAPKSGKASIVRPFATVSFTK